MKHVSVVSAIYSRACGDNLHWLEKRVMVGPCNGNPHNAVESWFSQITLS
jgi:hypothetical protein